MKTLRYEGPGHRLNVTGHCIVELGDTIELDDTTADRLLTDSRIHVTVVSLPEPPALDPPARFWDVGADFADTESKEA